MTMAFKIYPELGFVLTLGRDTVTGDELIKHATSLRAHPDFQPRFSQLSVYTDSSKMAAQGADLRSLADINPFHPGAHRVIAVADDVHFGMARMYGLLVESAAAAILVVRDVGEGLEAVGLGGRFDLVEQAEREPDWESTSSPIPRLP